MSKRHNDSRDELGEWVIIESRHSIYQYAQPLLLGFLLANYPAFTNYLLRAKTLVCLDGQMGNSEVGQRNIGGTSGLIRICENKLIACRDKQRSAKPPEVVSAHSQRLR